MSSNTEEIEIGKDRKYYDKAFFYIMIDTINENI